MRIHLLGNVSFLEKMLFTKHLAIMIKSGIPIAEAIGVIRDQNQNPTFRKIIGKVYEDVLNGHNLHESLAKYPQIFDRMYQSLITAAEESGNLEKNLEYLAFQLQKSYEFDRKIKGAMLYPMIILFMAIFLGGGISIFVLPQLANLFGSLDINLPLSTKVLLGIANFMKSYGIIVMPGFFGLLVLFRIAINTSLGKPYWDKFRLSVPTFGKFVSEAELSSIFRNLGLMLKSGLPISDALAVVVESTENIVFKNSLIRIKSAVDKGKTIESELSNGKHSAFPLISARMIGVGEKTGKLDEMLLYLGDFFEEEVDSMAKNLPTLLEPILLTIIALVVAFVAMAIISPIYQFTSGVQR